MELINIAISSILSGILGVVVSIHYHNRLEKRKWKIHILEQLLENRYDIQGEKFTVALNNVLIAFNDSKEVLSAFDYDTVNRITSKGEIYKKWIELIVVEDITLVGIFIYLVYN